MRTTLAQEGKSTCWWERDADSDTICQDDDDGVHVAVDDVCKKV